jgi:hypothetical protein
LQQEKYRDKKVRHAFAANLSLSIFFWLQDEMFTVKIVCSGEVNFRMSGVLTGITLERESNSPYAVTSCSKQFQVLCPNKSFSAPFFFGERLYVYADPG